jgi:uncharacterized membrane protein
MLHMCTSCSRQQEQGPAVANQWVHNLFVQQLTYGLLVLLLVQDVTYYVQAKARGEKITILDGLTGFFEPGKITAVVSC